MSDTVQKVKERLSILEVVGGYVKLVRAGKYWKGLSPFTKEKTPSFFVSPERGLYHCFSTGKGGDIFSFVEEMEGLDFKGALKLLAERAGVELIQERPEVRSEREQVYRALEAAAGWYQSRLAERPEVQEYLSNRGIDRAAVAHWSVGYAPKEWHSLKDALIQQGFTDRVLSIAGLVKRPDQGDGAQTSITSSYDRFRGRIMFPIRDVSGRCIAFSGRIFEDDSKHPAAKYINSPESPVFDKSRALYGLYEARSAIRDLGAAMLVEGQVDLLMAHKVGYRNAVATSGTAFTEHHAGILKRYSENLIIAYDGDRAGVAAAGRAATLALQLGMNVKVVPLPEGVDPADLILKDSSLFKDAVRKAEPVVDFFLHDVLRRISGARERRIAAEESVLPFIGAIANKSDQDYFIKRVAEGLDVSEVALREDLLRAQHSRSTGAVGSSALRASTKSESLIKLLTGIELSFLERGDPRAADVSALLDTYGRAAGDQAALIFEAELFLDGQADPDAAFRSIVADLSTDAAREEYRALVKELRTAEESGDAARAAALMEKLAALANRVTTQ